MILRLWPAMLALMALLACLQPALCQEGETTVDGERFIQYTPLDGGSTVYLPDNRRPALYTDNFGDCLGGSLINVTRFDAAYYRDNMTVLFHLEGNSALNNESLVMYIGVYAYGESRFDLTFNPCKANIASLCPLNSSIPITANGIIPINAEDVAAIPALALAIPDFEGQAILRIFANSTQSEIACYSAVVTNGFSFSQPKSVGTILGVFALVTVIASFGTAIYGEAVPTMRLHYAHSLSVGVVMAVFQHIFFTGALSVNWPSVLVAWWSNFAWAGGMIHSSTMQSSINHLIGNNIGNTSQVGAAPSDSGQEEVGGGYDISQIYKRGSSWAGNFPANHPFRRGLGSEIFQRDNSLITRRDVMQHHVERALQTRDTLASKSSGYQWYGHPVGAGLPLPGNYSGFAGTLAQEDIRASNAFMTGFLWLLILLVILVAAVIAFKWSLEGLSKLNAIKQERLKFFRDHWRRYATVVALRTCYIAFFLMMFLTIFEFTYQSSAGVKVVAAIVFLIFFIGIPGVAAYACYYKRAFTTSDPNSGSRQVEHKKLLGKIPWAGMKKTASSETREPVPEPVSDNKGEKKPFWRRARSADNITDSPDVVDNIHDNDDYTMKFGWLASRFRRTRWWFFTVWLFYEFLRAVFYAGASGYALAQVFGLLIIEFLAFVFIVWARPFEGRRLNLLVVYCLGFSKVASVALSAAFDVHFNLTRITTTVIGIVVIVIQGILTIITMIAVIVGAISSYMSMSRNREEFKPRSWHGMREKYFDHLDRVANDLPPDPKPPKEKKVKPTKAEKAAAAAAEREAAKEGFEVKGMRRLNKIEDEDADFASEMQTGDPAASYLSLDARAPTPANASDVILPGVATPSRASRAPSVGSQTNLPYGARAHRPSWTTRDFSPAGAETGERAFTPIDMNRTVSDDNGTAPSAAPIKNRHSRSGSLGSMFNKTRPAEKTVAPQASTDSLQVGGDVSTRDTIGMVPAPTMRPRSGTHGSARSSWGGSSEMVDSYAQAGSSRNTRYPLTPAQEVDEWGTPKVSQDEYKP
ncbi:hypothetical protein LTR37_019211 [Vermiconidia calcicola]|uniref:Uncharacterized protein n=1 Tax=Vermiconidia calcicola TaxID=1690605 RepID=A0ACC3MFZ7_9PEZI|nr:hypothetical protein LTR37_019211 [Vermiconidia calcicola]